MAEPRARRRWFAPEVVQTSAMDCGPAALKCLLEGHGIPVSYGRLREACQTDVDGSSIDTLEEIAKSLGLSATQVMIPPDHVTLPSAQALPALVIVVQPNGMTHFVVVWRRVGRWVQIMDPASGRRWLSIDRFQAMLYRHALPISATDWREWAATPGFLDPLRARMTALKLTNADRHLAEATADPTWHGIGRLDAAVRMVTDLVDSGGLTTGPGCQRLLEHILTQAAEQPFEAGQGIAERYWSVWSAPADADGSEQVQLRGAVLVIVDGLLTDPAEATMPRSPELEAALQAKPERPGRALIARLRDDGLLSPAILGTGIGLAAVSGMIEALLWRGVIDVGRNLQLAGQRAAGIGLLVILLLAFALLDWPLATGPLRMGRKLEARLRVAFLTKIPRLNDRYLQSRPTTDMAERSHNLYRLRLLPGLGGQALRSVCELLTTVAGLIWLDPRMALPSLALAAAVVAVPALLMPTLIEQDLRLRIHAGGLGQFYLDALLGLTAVRTHGAETAIRREHEQLLVEWARAARQQARMVVMTEGLQLLVSSVGVVGLLFWHLQTQGMAASTLLFIYWALSLPVIGLEIAGQLRQYPSQRNLTLRMLEPLGALEEPVSPTAHGAEVAAGPAGHGAALELQGIQVVAAGHPILDSIDLNVPPGSHIAVVGPSGAGKSSLVGLLLGWHRPAAGTIRVDGQPLDAAVLARLREQTAWVDPGTQLWNRSFLHNLQYGSGPQGDLSRILAEADLQQLLQQLPDGLQTQLGEGGGLVSGGEGQRVRLGRAMHRPQARLVILDEPFRGLDRDKRHALMASVRRYWQDATLLCITHDVGETLDFPRVLVIEGGQIVEDSDPAALRAQPESRYAGMLAAEQALRNGMWSDAGWRRLRIADGTLGDDAVAPVTP